MNVRTILQTGRQSNPGNSIEVDSNGELSLFEDKVLLENSRYKEIFGKRFLEDGYAPHKRGIVKICVGNKSIHRIFHSGNSLGLKKGEVGLTIIARMQLGLLEGEVANPSLEIDLIRGNRLIFWWDHPNHATRIAFKMGSISIGLGLMSIVATMF